MKHAAKDCDEQDKGFDGAFCEDALQILDMTLPEPRFRGSADQFGRVGTMESGPLKARKKAS